MSEVARGRSSCDAVDRFQGGGMGLPGPVNPCTASGEAGDASEGEETVERKVRFPVSGETFLLDATTGTAKRWDAASSLVLPRHGFAVLMIDAE